MFSSESFAHGVNTSENQCTVHVRFLLEISPNSCLWRDECIKKDYLLPFVLVSFIFDSLICILSNCDWQVSQGLKISRKMDELLQLFEVIQPKSQLVRVTVLQAHNVAARKSVKEEFVSALVGKASKLASEKMMPDPYIVLNIPNVVNGRRHTSTINNQSNPFWNETFEFHIDADRNNNLEISLMDADYIEDDNLAMQTYDLKVIPLNEEIPVTLTFNEQTQLELKFYRSMDESSPPLRLTPALCEEEIAYLQKRKEHVYRALQRLLGEENGPKSIDDVPCIAILGSGGGFRAMVGLSGAAKALHSSGILDCATYFSGISGSTWYISTLYSHPDFPKTFTPAEQVNELKLSIDQSPFGLLRPQQIYKYIEEIAEKRNAGHLISFTDLFGMLLRDTLLKTRPDARLSHQRAIVEDGTVPLPLYAGIHVKKNVQARVYHDWAEFSPFEIGLAKYGTFAKTELFGSKFFLGRLRLQFSEFPLHYLLGIWGSAFSVLLRQLLWMKETDKMITFALNCDTPKKEEALLKQLDEFAFNDDVESDDKPSRDLLEKSGLVPSKIQGIFHTAIDAIQAGDLFNNITGRAASIYNPMIGLQLNPFKEGENEITTQDDDETFKGLHEPLSTTAQSLYMVDGGLALNSPYPLLLRSQRNVQLYISFEFSSRLKDQAPPFKDLLLAAKWAKKVGVPFPPIKELIREKYSSGPVQEYYIFQHPDNRNCPTILHFVLINNKFKDFKAPGVVRHLPEDKKLADFKIFEEFGNPFSTFNFKYSHERFDQLSQLMEFNTLLGVDEIKRLIAELINPK